jgi:hypothetical protein
MDLFGTAELNTKRLETDFDRLASSLSTAESGQLQAFVARVQQDGRVSMNLRPMAMVSFLIFDWYQNIYQWAALRAEESSKRVDEIVRERLAEFAAGRAAFDAFFERATEFHYGALSIGGPGVGCFGEYCLVLASAPFDGLREIAWLPGDTLKLYFGGGKLDETSICRDLAPNSHRHILAAIKHVRDVSKVSEADWPVMLCSTSDFVECIFIAPVTVSSVEVVRMERERYDELFEFAFESFSAKLSVEKRFLVESFVNIKRLLKQKNVPLEVAA